MLYTIKFEPVDNVLIADLVASQSEIIQGETLILDASSSYISNLPIATQRRSMAYVWHCPGSLESYCSKQAGDRLAIPFSVVKGSKIAFEQP